MSKITIYIILHLFGNFMMIMALGGALVWSINQGQLKHVWKKQLGIFHGVGLLLSLVGGFGLLAVMKISFPFPVWVWGKIAIWLCFGGLYPLIVRNQSKAKLYWFVTLFLVLLALFFVQLKI